MKEQKGIKQLSFLKDALKFGSRYERSNIERVLYAVKLLRSKKKMEELVLVFSSFNYGAHLLNAVFPLYENREPFHSHEGITRLNESPVQVMGRGKYDEQIALGVAQGLRRDAILVGFNTRAEERGIDLQLYFHAEVPKPSTPSGLRVKPKF